MPGKAPVLFSGLSTETKRTDRLIGLASRAKVGTGESVLITGVAIGGTESKRVLIRAGGPALAGFGLTSTLPNPTLKIYRGATLIAQNDDWNPADAAEMSRLGLFAFPNGSKDAAILTTLAPGSYTAHVSDLSGTGTGVALAEIYDASAGPPARIRTRLDSAPPMATPVIRTDSPMPTLAREAKPIRRSVRTVSVLRPENSTFVLPGNVSVAVVVVVAGLTPPLRVTLPDVVVAARV